MWICWHHIIALIFLFKAMIAWWSRNVSAIHIPDWFWMAESYGWWKKHFNFFSRTFKWKLFLCNSFASVTGVHAIGVAVFLIRWQVCFFLSLNKRSFFVSDRICSHFLTIVSFLSIILFSIFFYAFDGILCISLLLTQEPLSSEENI